MRMPFGQYQGEELEDLPTDYLEWCLENIEFRSLSLKLCIQSELQRREQPELEEIQPRPNREVLELRQRVFLLEQEKRSLQEALDANTRAFIQANGRRLQGGVGDLGEKLKAWHRGLAKKWHPDRGGSTEAMQAVNDGLELFQKIFGLNQKRRG